MRGLVAAKEVHIGLEGRVCHAAVVTAVRAFGTGEPRVRMVLVAAREADLVPRDGAGGRERNGRWTHGQGPGLERFRSPRDEAVVTGDAARALAHQFLGDLVVAAERALFVADGDPRSSRFSAACSLASMGECWRGFTKGRPVGRRSKPFSRKAVSSPRAREGSTRFLRALGGRRTSSSTPLAHAFTGTTSASSIKVLANISRHPLRRAGGAGKELGQLDSLRIHLLGELFEDVAPH